MIKRLKMIPVFNKTAGINLIVGSILLVATMVLHPSGGSIDHILKIKTIIIVSHSLAILSCPFIAFGFWGLSVTLSTKSKISMLAFIISGFGLFAVMIAAAVNGIILPLYLSKISTIKYNVDTVNLITTYGGYLNVAMDYILLVAFALSISIWSFIIIRGTKFPKWIGYYGISFVFLGFIGAFNEYNLIDLFGFRIIIFCIVSWIVAVGYKILSTNNNAINLEE